MALREENTKKIVDAKAFLEKQGLFVEEKPNGQLVVDGVNFWATTGKFYNPKQNIKGQGINAFVQHLKSIGSL